MKTYVVDTNIILDDVQNLYKLYDNENKIVIPETVVDELDQKKSLFDELGFQAREFARLIDSASAQKVVERNDEFVLTEIKMKNLVLYIASKFSYNCSDEPSNILNDRKIIEVAKLFDEPIFLTFDSMCRVRAISAGLKTEVLGKTEIKEIQSFKELSVQDAKDNGEIIKHDPDYKLENCNYLLKYKNGKNVLARIKNGHICFVDTRLLDKQSIRPVNMHQKFFVDAMIDSNVSICVLNALAGTGKTLLAISTALRLVKEKQFSKVVYIRNSIESLDRGEDVGYLSGNVEKFAIYNHPLYDSLEFIARKMLEKSNENKSRKIKVEQTKVKEEVQKLIDESGIETMWVGELRGRTISDAFVVVDECLHEDQKIITDVGVLPIKKIEEIFKFSNVNLLSYNIEGDRLEFKPLLSLKKELISETKERMCEIFFDDGTSIKCTNNHKLYDKDLNLITIDEILFRLSRRIETKIKNLKSGNYSESLKVVGCCDTHYDSYIYTPQVLDNENYFLDNYVLSKNCQNISRKTMQLILSRLDKDCKVVAIGSTKQIDNPYVNKFNNSLATLVEACRGKHDINLWVGELTNVVRGPITEFAEQVLSN